MKKLFSFLAVALLFSTTVSAFSLGDVADTGKIKMQTCMTDEAKKALAQGTLNSENLEKKAAEIASICAASASMEANPEAVKQAATILKSFL